MICYINNKPPKKGSPGSGVLHSSSELTPAARRDPVAGNDPIAAPPPALMAMRNRLNVEKPERRESPARTARATADEVTEMNRRA